MILGIDEVGRGPWAGPLVVGAVVFAEGFTIDGLADSKKLTKKKRDQLDMLIREQALGYGLGWVHSDELDEIGLAKALRVATIRAVERITASYQEIIIDGTINFLADTNKGRYVQTMAKADGLIPAVSAASIIAKVARDAYMSEQDVLYPEYGFGRHVGYGTAAHRQAIERHGTTLLHRRSFAPIAKLEKQRPDSYETGIKAEQVVVDYLIKNGVSIRDRNWRIRNGELDIVGEKDGTLWVIEVKHRSTHTHGSGADAIHAQKRRVLKRTIQQYTQRSGCENRPVELYLAMTTGQTPKLERFDNISDSLADG